MNNWKCLFAAGTAILTLLTGYSAFAEDNLLAEAGEWGLYLEADGDAVISSDAGKVTIAIEATGELPHSVQAYLDGVELLEGAQYQLSFDIASTQQRKLDWRIQKNDGNYIGYAHKEGVEAGTEPVHLSYDFTMKKESDPNARFCLNLGDRGKKQGLEGHEVTIENVELLMTDSSQAVAPVVKPEPADILVNQSGYHINDKKTAILRDAALDDKYEILDAQTKESVYQGSFGRELSGGSSAEVTREADFSDFTVPGCYVIHTEHAGDSYPFTIAENVYDELLKDSVKMLTLQRCGVELSEEIAGEFAHPACHTELATIYGTDQEIEVSGGWHDAGDYGRYTVPAAKTVADMMLAYENYEEVFDALEVPAEYSILSEARFELEWMLKMQNEEGGIYHKVTGLNFDGVCMPENCKEKLYVLPVSLAATGDFAASMYMAARVYKDIDAEFADKCKAAADRAFAYFEEHKGEKGFVNPSDCNTGEYGDEQTKDEYFWAAAERYKTTGEEEILELITSMPVKSLWAGGLGWADMSGYGMYAYLTTEGAPENQDISGAFFRYADEVMGLLEKDSYHSSIPNDYPWGSNMTIANNGMILLMAGQLKGDDAYIAAAQTQLDYLLGVNTTGYSFVSGYGAFCMQHPHHRPSQTKGKAVKGMLSGGPNNGLQDPCALGALQGKAKANCFIDNDQSYSTNEVAIYWNSPLIYLTAGRIAALNEKGG